MTRRRRWRLSTGGRSLATGGRWRAAAAVLLLTGVGGTLAWWEVANRADSSSVALAAAGTKSGDARFAPVDNKQDLNVAAAGTAPSSDAAAEPPSADTARVTPGANENHVPAESEFSGLEPGDLLQDLSVSEQEAVFDLLESEPIELARVSL